MINAWSKQICEIFLLFFYKKNHKINFLKYLCIINCISTYLIDLMRPAQGSSTIKSLAMHCSSYYRTIIVDRVGISVLYPKKWHTQDKYEIANI